MTEKTEAPQKKPGHGEVMIWLSVQLIFVFLFLYCQYHVEDHVIATILGNTTDASLNGTTLYLYNELLPLLPGQLWRSFWPILCLSFAFMLLGRLRWYFLALVGTINMFLIIGDRVYYEFFSSLLSVKSLRAAHQAWAVRSSITTSLDLGDILLLSCFIPLIVFGYFLNRRLNFSLAKAPITFACDKVIGIILFIVALNTGFTAFQLPIAGLADLNHNAKPQTSSNEPKKLKQRFVPTYMSSARSFAMHFGVLNYHLKDFFSQATASYFRMELQPHHYAMAERVFERSKIANDFTSPLQGIAQGRNVIVISMEAFQHYLFDLKVDGREVTPTMNALRRKSLSFEYCLDNITKGGTSDAEFSMLTGLLADPYDIVSLSLDARNPPLALPATLQNHGYYTISMHGFEPTFWNRNINHPALGISEMFFKDKYSTDTPVVYDVPFFEESFAHLETLPQPFFAFMISISSHHPYAWVEDKADEFDVNLPNSILKEYLQAAHYADGALGIFLEKMEKNGILANSLLVIYGDHVAPMDSTNKELANKYFGINPGTHREMRIPYLISIPGLEPIIDEHREAYSGVVTGLQDTFPTVLHLLGIDVPFGIFGTHPFAPIDQRPPQPYFRKASGFIYEGALFSPDVPVILDDDEGPLFNPMLDRLPTEEEHRSWHEQAGEAFLVHQFIYNQAIQRKVTRPNQTFHLPEEHSEP